MDFLPLLKKKLVFRGVLYSIAAVLAVFVVIFSNLFFNGVDHILDRFDSRQHIIITATNVQESYSAGEDIIIALRVENTTGKTLDVSPIYSIEGGLDGHPDEEVRKNYVTVKDKRSITSGVFVYENIVAFSGSQTENWEAGNYTVRLHYEYTYRQTHREHDIFFAVYIE